MKNINNDIKKRSMDPNPATAALPVQSTARPNSPASSVPKPENLAEAAINLIAAQVLEALRELDWTKWKRQMLGNSANLQKLIKIAGALSRESLAYEKFRAEIEAHRQKRAPTLEEIEEIERKLNLL